MQHKIIRKLKSEDGSSLAFVIIIGVVILMLVASIMAIANSDFTFTQQSLESRQAYIDAKSVIEFGKIEINSRMTALNNKNIELDGLYKQYKAEAEKSTPDTSVLSQYQQKISTAESERTTLVNALGSEFIIYGKTKDVADTLTSEKPSASTNSDEESLAELGKLTFDYTKYQFKIETDRDNLRRKLDYQVSFNYTESSKTETTTGSSLKTPTQPTYTGSILTHFSPWSKGEIYCGTKYGGTGQYKVYGCFSGINGGSPIVEDNAKKLNLNNTEENEVNMEVDNDISWAEGRSLYLTAHNVCMDKVFNPSDCSGGKPVSNFYITAVSKNSVPGDIYFAAGYTPANQGSNTLTAEGGNVVINGDLKLAVNSKLVIKCKNLFVNGNITLDPGNPGATLDITAENIVVSGNVSLNSGTALTSNCPSIWIGGNISTYSSGDVLSFQNVNYLKASNINLSQGCQFTVTGSSINGSQMVVGSIQPNDGGNTYKINVTNFASFTCQDFTVNDHSMVELTSKIMIIKGMANFSWAGLVNITTQYLDCAGQVSITRMYSPLTINAYDGQSLNIRFAGSYSQVISTVNINGADLVIFGGNSFVLDGDNKDTQSVLKVAADDIYLDNNSINIEQFYGADRSDFYYTGKNNGNTNLHMKTPVIWDSEEWHHYKYQVNSGVYNTIKGQFPEVDTSNWLYNMTPDPYQGPEWDKVKLPVGAGSTTVTVTDGSIANGPEKYY